MSRLKRAIAPLFILPLPPVAGLFVDLSGWTPASGDFMSSIAVSGVIPHPALDACTGSRSNVNGAFAERFADNCVILSAKTCASTVKQITPADQYHPKRLS